METFDQKPQLCPACGYLLDAATTAIGEGMPGPGDYSICFSCATILEYHPAGLRIAFEPLDLPFAELIKVRKMQRNLRERGPLDNPGPSKAS